MAGIKETTEVLVAANELALFLIKRIKDGIGVDDAAAIYEIIVGDGEFKQQIIAAVENIQAVGDELSDIDVTEAVGLGVMQIQYIPKIVDALKKEETVVPVPGK